MTFPKLLVVIVGLLLSLSAFADEPLIRLDTRPGVTVALLAMPRPMATATVILLPGGAGGFGSVVDGKPNGGNFLVRSANLFAQANLNVLIMGRPSDKAELDYADRVGEPHLRDIEAVVAWARSQWGKPVWLIGTSRGTVSATAAAIRMGEGALAGIVLTSSVTNYKKVGAVPSQELSAIRLPVLVIHHTQDGCGVCRPYEAPNILRGLRNAPIKKLQMLDGGGNPSGDPCEAQHYHGFVGMEAETVAAITGWIAHPAE